MSLLFQNLCLFLRIAKPVIKLKVHSSIKLFKGRKALFTGATLICNLYFYFQHDTLTLLFTSARTHLTSLDFTFARKIQEAATEPNAAGRFILLPLFICT